MLDAALANRLAPPASTSQHAPLLVLSDTLLQPSLVVLRHFIASALSTPAAPPRRPAQPQRVVLLCAEQDTHKLLPPHGSYDAQRVSIVDATLAAPYASSSSAPLASAASHALVDLSSSEGAQQLVRAAEEAVGRAADDEPVLLVLDSANALADELDGGIVSAVKVVKKVLDVLKGRKGSRLLLVHHDDFPAIPPGPASSTSMLSPSLLSTLVTPTISPSTLHLTLHPSSHLALLARDYSLSIPLSPSPSSPDDSSSSPSLDLRTPQFLDSLRRRAHGDPFVRPERAEDEDERVPLDALGASVGAPAAAAGSGGARDALSLGLSSHASGRSGAALGGRGGCVVQWTCRGLDVVADPAAASGAGGSAAAGRLRQQERERASRGEVKKVVKWGFEGVVARAVRGDKGELRVEVREAGLGEVLDPAQMGLRSAALTVTPASSAPAPLPFSLSLTDSQRQARSLVANPFAGADKPIYGEAGYEAPVLPGAAATVEYTPDRGDDFDEEDPDEDLELHSTDPASYEHATLSGRFERHQLLHAWLSNEPLTRPSSSRRSSTPSFKHDRSRPSNAADLSPPAYDRHQETGMHLTGAQALGEGAQADERQRKHRKTIKAVVLGAGLMLALVGGIAVMAIVLQK
ncbi:hypothetical protein Rhopal_000563-T1 [Rhodotorula paludigena]|uniref:Elongator complex protein 5 n=1 Tax=Rhodotorula paludigena TaxID=86838 RepID=A0AAV5GG89_9BASI|nr:hypothetical protein Rhopal_000563-T1 [Rhodotorula paludigena]